MQDTWRFKVTPSFYQTTHQTNATDLNVRANEESHALWIGQYDQAGNLHQTRLGYEYTLNIDWGQSPQFEPLKFETPPHMEFILQRLIHKLLPLGAVLVLAGCASHAVRPPANDPVTLGVNLFRSATNIPIYMAEEKGAFAQRNVRLELQFTPNSTEQRSGLAAGRIDIAHAAVDNAIVMVEVAKVDAVIVAGGDSGFLELYARPEIKTLADVKGKAMVVDAPNTAYVLVARKILKNAGLLDNRDYRLASIGGTESRVNAFSQSPDKAVGMLNPPWTFLADSKGARSFGKVKDLFGPYQAIAPIVMRSWSQANQGAWSASWQPTLRVAE